MSSFYALVACALAVSIASPVAAQVAPVPSPSASPIVLPSALPATVTVPFTAPAGWTQLPRGFTLTEIKNVMRGTKKGSGLFGQAVLPLPSGIVAAALLQLRTVLSKSKTKVAPVMRFTKMCGGSASVTSVKVPGKYSATIETTVLSSHGLTYATLYSRSGTSPDPAIEATIRSSCPLADGTLPDISAPAGWTPLQKGLDFQLAGIWLGNAPLQMMTLLRGAGIPNMGSAAPKSPQTISAKQKTLNYKMHVQSFKFCGTSGVLVDVQFTVPPGFGMTYSAAAAQGMDGTYLLSYFHPTSYTDANAQAALRTLCAGAPLPEPSGSPLPFP
jgi:hypothetical protein